MILPQFYMEINERFVVTRPLFFRVWPSCRALCFRLREGAVAWRCAVLWCVPGAWNTLRLERKKQRRFMIFIFQL